jgi:hypothetical protein
LFSASKPNVKKWLKAASTKKKDRYFFVVVTENMFQ